MTLTLKVFQTDQRVEGRSRWDVELSTLVTTASSHAADNA